MSKQLYIGNEVLKPILTIDTLEKNITRLQSKLRSIEIGGLPGERLKELYSEKLEIQQSLLSWYKQVTQA